MELNIKMLDSDTEEKWNKMILSSPQGTLFHTIPWLRLVQKQTNTELLPFMFYQGSQLVGVFPFFIKKQGIAKLGLSPPTKSYLLYLGPVIAEYDALKQDKKERILLSMQEELDKYLFNKIGCNHVRIRTSPGLIDSRPLKWSGYIVDSHYTYRINLSKGIENIWERLDSKLRGEINKAIRKGVTVRTGDKDDLIFIHDLLYQRYIEQGNKPVDYKKFLLDVYEQFYPDNVKIFVAEYDNRRIGGTINLIFKNIMWGWVGMPKSQEIGISPNDLIQWEAINWGYKNGIIYYEEMDDGDNPRFRFFKAKWNPDLIIWYEAKKYSSFIYKVGEKLYHILKKSNI
jgi:lipid II:glycine glycyltransferase (peptidoglycan interpeptide bridge formation enzyme)